MQYSYPVYGHATCITNVLRAMHDSPSYDSFFNLNVDTEKASGTWLTGLRGTRYQRSLYLNDRMMFVSISTYTMLLLLLPSLS